MDVRIGIAQSAQVIELELGDVDRDEIKKMISDAVGDSDGVLWLTDRKGKEVALPSAQISFVELSSVDPERRIGFGA